MIFGFMYLSTFGLARAAKSFPGIYRNTTKLQKVRIWRPRTSATSDLRPKNVKKFFLHFSRNWAILSILSHTLFFRQIGDLAPASGAMSPNWRNWQNVGLMRCKEAARSYYVQKFQKWHFQNPKIFLFDLVCSVLKPPKKCNLGKLNSLTKCAVTRKFKKKNTELLHYFTHF